LQKLRVGVETCSCRLLLAESSLHSVEQFPGQEYSDVVEKANGWVQ
jgi:hypothetical protein